MGWEPAQLHPALSLPPQTLGARTQPHGSRQVPSHMAPGSPSPRSRAGPGHSPQSTLQATARSSRTAQGVAMAGTWSLGDTLPAVGIYTWLLGGGKPAMSQQVAQGLG